MARVGDGADLVAAAHDDLAAGRPRDEIAARLPRGVAAAFAAACAERGEPGTVVLSGGSFQNLRLLGSLRGRLEAEGFRVLSHRLVPPNDGGVSYGQAAVAASEDRVHVPRRSRRRSSRSSTARAGLAKVDISGVRREVSVALVDEPAAPLESATGC